MRAIIKPFFVLATLLFFNLSGVFWPGLAAAAGAQTATCSLSDYATASGSNPACVIKIVGGVPITYPRLHYQVLSSVYTQSQPGFDTSLVAGNGLKVSLNQAAQLLGPKVKASDVADMISTLPAASSIVFGRFSPQNNQLSVQILRVQKTNNKLSVLMAPFTPQQGNQWAASRTYMTLAEKQSNAGPGPNPFARYDQGDGLFHNLQMADATAVLGAVMRYASAPMALLQVAHSRVNQYTTEHGFIRKTITYHVDGYLSPQWYVGLPIEMQTEGGAAALCAVNENPCQPGHLLLPFANFSQWTGGNLKEQESLVYKWQESHSSWTVIAMMILVMIVSFVVPELLYTVGAVDTTAAGMVSTLLGAGYGTVVPGLSLITTTGALGAAESALVEGLAYLSEQFLFNGARSLDSPQSTYSGTVGWGTTNAAAPSSPQEQALQTIEGGVQAAPPGQFAATVCGDTAGTVCPTSDNAFDASYPQVVPGVGSNSNFSYNGAIYVRDTQ